MTLKITYFASDTYFSSDTLFGYSVVDDYTSAAEADIDNVLKGHGDFFVVTRESETTDSMGDVNSTNKQQFTIYGSIQDITRTDRQIVEMGYPRNGEVKGFFKPIYYMDSAAGDSIVEGDILTDRHDEYWRVVTIVARRYINNVEIFRTLILRNMSQEATNA